MKPKRIQRKTTKGWRMPENTVYVGRGSKRGNKFRVGGYFMMGDIDPGHRFAMTCMEAIPEVGKEDKRFTLIETPEQAVEWYKRYIELYPYSKKQLLELKGKNLACWCDLDKPCHADVLLAILKGKQCTVSTH